MISLKSLNGIAITLTSRLLLDLRESSMDTKIVNRESDIHGTVDIAMSHVVFQQLRELSLG
jgi:hypothetical protein